MKKVRMFLLSCLMAASAVLGAFRYQPMISAADTSLYPVQTVNLTAFTTNRNLNISASSLNTAPASGSTAENWRIDYVSDGVYNIVNAAYGTFLTASGTSCTVSAAKGNTSQQWKIEGVTTDFDGYYLYYKITNVSTGTALTYYQTTNTIGLAAYTGDGAQKWKLNSYGAEGFAANCMVNEGEKACAIGGLLGETVIVTSVSEFKTALDSTKPLTIVVNGNFDMQSEYHTRIRDNKTIIGSYSANTLQDCMLRTNNEYGNEGDNPSDNIIIKNIDFEAVNVEDRILVNIWSSRNIWIDHCTFNSKLTRDRDEVGKFIWINTPYESYMDAKDRLRSPDYITISYCTFTNRYWTVAYGTQNDETTRCRTTLMYNLWDQCVRRCPQIGNGIGHIYNNCYIGSDSGNDSGTSQIISGDGSNMLSENCRFQSFTKSQVITGGSDPYRDSGSYMSDTSSSTPYKVNYSPSVQGTWKPSEENYGYSLIEAYNTSGNDTKKFCQTYAGRKTSLSEIKYITDSDMASWVSVKYESPFLTDGFDSAYGNLSEDVTAAVLKEGAVYMIKNVNSGMYMEVEGGTAANGTNVQQWGADSSASHNTWRVLSAGDGYYYLYSQIGNKITYLLDVDGNSSDNGTNIGIWSDTGADAQQFKFVLNEDGTYTIRTKTSNDKSCVEIADASNSSGANVQQWAVNGNSCQSWILEQAEDTGCTMDTNSVYMFKNSASGMYMEVEGGKAADGTNVQQWGANGISSHNSWTLKEFGGGYYYILSQLADGKTYYLNIEDAESKSGGNVQIWTNNKTSAELFKFVQNPDGSYNILTRASKDVCAVEVADASASSGANVQQWEVNGNSCQKWLAEKSAVVTTVTTSVTTTVTSVTTVSTSASVPETSSTEETHIKGDVNMDNKVSVSDVVLIQKYLVGAEKISEEQGNLADLDDNSIINVFDAVLLRRLVLTF